MKMEVYYFNSLVSNALQHIYLFNVFYLNS